jgi:hypothetical protein
VSACFRIGDKGIMSLCQSRGVFWDGDGDRKRRRGRRSSLTSLKIANLPLLTDSAIHSISSLDSLLLLDIRDCQGVTSGALYQTVMKLPLLIDVDARFIRDDGSSISSLLRNQSSQPKSLHFVNNRPFHSNQTCLSEDNRYCTARKHSQRLQSIKSVPLQAMIHCIDCQLLPSFNRGVCSTCASTCHRGHRTFLGSWTRFYCDCPYGIARNECAAISPCTQTA